MKPRRYSDNDPQDNDDDQTAVSFLLPQWNNVMGFSCTRDYAKTRQGVECGCPRCLKKAGLVLCYHVDDWNESGDLKAMWRKHIVSAKTASYASHLICYGYE